jgi:predicted outer membrane repeat protein
VCGGLYTRSDNAIITDCLFEGNISSQGGGLYIRFGSPTVTDCRFYDNTSGWGGGGVFIDRDCSPVITGCIFAGNTATSGSPSAPGGGGLLVRNESSVELVGCTFSGNSSNKGGGGIFCEDNSSVTLDRCIVAFSGEGEALYWDGTGTTPSLFCCDLYGNAGGDWVGGIAGQFGISGNISDDPLFCSPGSYDFGLCPGSPCHLAGGCGTIGALGWITGFGLTSVEDTGGDLGGYIDLTWSRNWYDTEVGDTVTDYYTVWRRDDAPVAAGIGRFANHALLLDDPDPWVRIDSVEALGQETYAVTCSTLCDSTDLFLCWSVFFIRAHSAGHGLEYDALPDSGYSYNNTAYEAWTDVTTTVLQDRDHGAGVSWADYDGDDDLDILITNRAGDPNRLFRNDNLTAPGFVNATVPPVASSGNSRGCAWGDYDDDGDLDLYIANRGVNGLYRNDGGGVFADVTSPPLDDPSTGHTATWIDCENDGDLDLYVINNGANKLLRNDGGVFADATSGPLGDSGFGTGGGWADFDSDGDMDVYIANYTEANVLLENLGGGVFSDVTSPALAITAPSHGVAWGDYDNDGDLDLYVSNEGANNLLSNDAGVFADITPAPLDDEGDGRGVAWADYNLDGYIDLYLVNLDGPDYGANRLFKNLGDGSFVRRGSGSSPFEDTMDGFSAAWGDYDKDGDPDLYVVNDWNDRNGLYRNDLGPGHHWLEIRLVGIISNTYGVGARVRLVAGDMTQMREIAGASGYASQGPLTAAFGLGTATSADTVEVIWPSGATQVLTGVASDQYLEIVEDDLSGNRIEPEAIADLRLHPARPNPFDSRTLIRYDLPRSSRVSMRIFDVTGRLVRTLLDGELKPPGTYRACWDGRSSKGRAAAPGVYFCELSAGSARRMQRIVLLR